MRYFQSVLIMILLFSCGTDEECNIDPLEYLPNEIEVFNEALLENSLVLSMNNGGQRAFLMDKKGNELFEWSFEDRLGQDLEILPDGRMLGMFKVDEPMISFGGFGGIVRILDLDGSVDWEFIYHSEDYITHHDVEMLPNGNVIFLVWERLPFEDAQSMGIDVGYDLYTEALIEVDPKTEAVVWEWHSYDHIVQSVDTNKPNYGEVSEYPQLINHSYVFENDDSRGLNGDIMHANGIDYDRNKDVIYMSVNAFGEVWVIDHSTTISEASSHLGGRYGKGGDLIYRFGNPTAYGSELGTRLFYNVHFPNYLESNEPGADNILVYNNGKNVRQSTVYELKMPEVFELIPNQNNEPEIVWSFTDPHLYAGGISGAVRLDNGNTLICEGDFGFWEVTPGNDVVWKYNGGGDQKFWRAYDYASDDPAITNLGL